MKSVMKHQFSQVPQAQIPRSSFDRSHGLKTAFDAGYLIPIFVDEALPGDTFNLRMNGFARMSTPLYPIMDNIVMDTHFFAVPYRLLWSNWEKFNGAQDNPGDSTSFTIPQITYGKTEDTLQDYFGLPVGAHVTGGTTDVSSLPFRAYNLIWNEWYRDQNLQDSVVVDTDDGPDTPGDYVLLKRGKRHDYFTSCLPWPQKGTAVDMPIGTSAPLMNNTSGSNSARLRTPTHTLYGGVGLSAQATTGLLMNDSGTQTLYLDTNGTQLVDLSSATGATINDLRESFQIQKIYERDARSGTRYTEIVRAHFGVTSPDARLQRPEYLGGGSSVINVHPVSNTSSGTGSDPVGSLSAFATGSMSGHGFTKSFTEHCVIIGLISARADLTYQQGVNRMWSRSTRWDFYWPGLSHIGEQAVLLKEIYLQGNVNDDNVFGYQERYAEYRYKPSLITGAFRSAHSSSLDPWHLSQEFASAPSLDDTFIQENPPMSRILATPAEPDFILDAYFNLKCARPMPIYGVPGLLDHF
jgi:hypothetical protein